MIEANLDQKTIDILLTCRKAIDDHRIRKEEYRDAQKSVAENPVSTSAAITDSYTTMKSDFTSSRNIYLDVLANNGFESFDEFFKFNEAMCIEVLKEYRTATRKCDFCIEYKGTPPCVVLLGSSACGETKSETSVDLDYDLIFRIYKNGNSLYSTNDGDLVITLNGEHHTFKIRDKAFSICPNRQNYYKCEVIDSDFPFSILWR